MKALFDSGGSNTLIHSSCLPPGATSIILEEGPTVMKTIAGNFLTMRKVYVKDLSMPEFDKCKQRDGVEAFVFDSPCNYDIILGQNFLSDAGIVMDFEYRKVTWMDNVVKMKPPGYWEDHNNLYYALSQDPYEDDDNENEFESFAVNIEEAKYEKVDGDEVARKQ